MTEERDRSGYPNQPYAGDSERGDGGMREPRDPNGREPHQRQGFGEQQEPGMHRGPRRSRYGRRRMPGEGGGDYQQHEHREHRQHHDQRPYRDRGPADQAGEDVDNYLPSFIAGPNGGADPYAAPSGGQGGYGGEPSGHQGYPQRHQQHQPQHHQGGGQSSYQPSHHQGGQSGGHGGGHGGGQGGGHPSHMHQEHHPAHQPMQPEEPSPETQAAAAEFAQWEASNPQLRGLLICNPTFKRGEPIVRGTRIPARILAAIAKMGSSVDEMLQDYPALTREGLDAALAFAAAHPRRASADAR